MAEATPQPLVSAIVLSFNRREETLACLACLRAQTYSNLEVLVVDNGSADNSADAIAEHFPEVTLIRNTENLGAWGPRDTAITQSGGEFIFMVDNDTEFGPDVVQRLVARIVTSPEIGVIAPAITDLEGKSINNLEFPPDPEPIEFYRYQFHGCAALIRRAAYDQAGGFPHHYFVAGGEGYLSPPLVDAGFRILYFPEVTVRHLCSPKGRILRQRFLQANLHRMQNVATFNPFLSRVLLDFAWKNLFFLCSGLRRGYFLLLPAGLWLHLREFAHSLSNHRKPISMETQRLLDHLALHQVRTAEQYEAITPRRCSPWTLLRHRLRQS